MRTETTISVRTDDPTTTTTSRRGRGRRGVALVLVLISLATASVLTAFYLTSQDNSSAIGANAQQSASAEWASRSGAALGVAALETTLDLDTLSPLGVIAEEIPISGGAVSVFVTDLEGDPAAESDTDLIITAVATVNGVTPLSQRLVMRMPNVNIEDSIDPQMGEFGLYAGARLSVDSTSAIGVWPLSPRYGGMGKIGGQYVYTADVTIDPDAAVSRTAFYVDADANASLVTMAEDARFSDGAALPVVPPVASPAKPSQFSMLIPQDGDGDGEDADSDSDGDQSEISAGMSVNAPQGRYGDIDVHDGGVLELGDPSDDATVSFYSAMDFSVYDLGEVHVHGQVFLEVRSDLEILDYGAVTLATPASSLTVFVDNGVLVHDAGLGVDVSVAQDPARASGDVSSYVNPRRMQIFASRPADGGSGAATILISENAKVIGNVHAPGAMAFLQTGGTLMGRLAADQVSMFSGASILIDPSLDPLTGFTNVKGALYDPMTGELVSGLETALDSFSASAGAEALLPHIQALVDTTAGAIPVDLGGGGPTPRSGSRVISKPWPRAAHAIEGLNETTTNSLDGLRVVPKFDQMYDFDTGSGGTVETTIESLAAPVLGIL